jgi:hypothetical protein
MSSLILKRARIGWKTTSTCWKTTRLSAASSVSMLQPSRAERPPSGPGWLHEIKLDGFRTQARRDAAGVRLLTRGNDWTGRFPLIAQAAGTRRACRSGPESFVGTSSLMSQWHFMKKVDRVKFARGTARSSSVAGRSASAEHPASRSAAPRARGDA